MAMGGDALSDRQFKRRVFDELQTAGTIDGLKGTLRSRLVGVLQRRDPGVFKGSGPAAGHGQQSLWQRAANTLYVEYLAHQNYSYALSVFQPECGLTDQQLMSRDEMKRVLCLGPTSSVARYLPKPPAGLEVATASNNDDANGGPLLLGILQALADMGSVGARREIQTQTDDYGDNSSLALRLQQIDDMHERAVETERLAPLRGAEERMAVFQRECESRLRGEMDEQVRRVREHEVGQARLEAGRDTRAPVQRHLSRFVQT
jgi:oral-facial-digital syndrome 1 protein